MEAKMRGISMTCPKCGAEMELINVLTGPIDGGTYVAHIYHCSECNEDTLTDDMILDDEDF